MLLLQQQAQYLHQFVLHASLDAVDEATWTSKELHLKVMMGKAADAADLLVSWPCSVRCRSLDDLVNFSVHVSSQQVVGVVYQPFFHSTQQQQLA